MNIKVKTILTPLTWLFMTATVATTVTAANYPIAGTAPSQRPEGAPSIEWVEHNRAWFQHALTGINRPYPGSLYFLDNQGNWYTPFTHPGMTGPYDLRRWHH